jgi:hypothetical protein
MELIRYDSLIYLADFIVDFPAEYYSNQGVTRKQVMPPLNSLDQLFNGCKLFVKTDLLPSVSGHLETLQTPIHLITGNSDITPDNNLIRSILNNTNIRSWVSNHIEKIDDKILQIPAGFQEFGLNRSNWVTYPTSETKEITFLITPMGDTNPNRKELDSLSIDGLVRLDGRLKYVDYINYIGKAKYTFCPAGNAVDSHRVCESIIMDSIPIVKTSILDPMYKEMGCLVVNDWRDVKPKKIKLNSKVTTLEYWKNRIFTHQNNFKG